MEEIEKTPLTFNDLASANLTGFDRIINSEKQLFTKTEEYDNTELDAYIVDKGVDLSLDELQSVYEQKNLSQARATIDNMVREKGQIERITDAGGVGLGLSLAVGVLDAPSYVVGGIFGKVAKGVSTAGKFSKRASAVTDGVAIAATGGASVGMLQAGLESDLTTEQVAIASVLGFGIGYSTSGLTPRTPQGLITTNKFLQGKNTIELNQKREVPLLKFMSSPSDKLKASDNPLAVELGYKATRSVKYDGLQDDITLNDALRESNAFLKDSGDEVSKYTDNFEKTYNKKFDSTDELEVERYGASIEHKYLLQKDTIIDELKKKEINIQSKEIEKNHLNNVMQIEQEFVAKSDEIVAAFPPFKPKPMPMKITKLDLTTHKYVQTKESKLEFKLAKQENRNAKERYNTQIRKAVRHEKKLSEAKLKNITKERDINLKAVNNGKFTDDALIEFEKIARVKAGKHADDLIENVPTKYRELIKIINKFNQKHGEALIKHDVDGLSTLDNKFYWGRQYDEDAITSNYDGAVQAFTRALSKNFDTIDKDLLQALSIKAQGIVNKIISNSSSIENINVERQFLKIDAKTNIIGSRLKGRSLRLDASELVDFSKKDIFQKMQTYNKSVGGRIAVKKVLGVDKNYKVSDLATANNLNAEDLKELTTVVQQAQGTFGIDPQGNSFLSKLGSAFNKLNHINFGGWFGVNTLSDLSNISNEFGLARSMKYLTKDISDSLNSLPDKEFSRRLANYVSVAGESVLHNRAVLFGQDGVQASRSFFGEKTLSKGNAFVSKYSGMNMIVDMMDRVAAMSSLDLILKAPLTPKNIKTMNRMGISQENIAKLRNNKKLVSFDKSGTINKFDFEVLDENLRVIVERGLRRSVADVVIKAGDLDSPAFLTTIFGSHAVAKSLFQFTRFPTVAYTKISKRMLYNFDAVDALGSVAVSSMILGLTTQMKDIGKSDKRFDLSTDGGKVNVAKRVIEMSPQLSILGLGNSYVDILGRVLSKVGGVDYKGFNGGVNQGVTMSRVGDVSNAFTNILNGEVSDRDMSMAYGFMSTNIAYIDFLNNMVRDEIKGK